MSELNYAIDGGTVSIEDGTKGAEEYAPPRKVRVQLDWSPREDDDPTERLNLFNHVSALASAKVAELLGRTAPAASAATPAAEPTTRKRRTAAEIAADKAAEDAAKTPAADPMGLEGPATTTAPVVVEDPDPLGLGLASSPVEATAITDKELIDAVQTKNVALKDPPKIKALVAKYNPEGVPQPLLGQIPLEKRAAFLVELKDLA